MRTRYVTVLLSGVVSVATLAANAAAQRPAPAGPSVITVGRGEVEVEPDRARLQFGVETRAPTAAAAAGENGRRQRAVLDTIQRMGIAARQLQTANLQVTPEMVYPGQGLPPKVAGYLARNSVRIEVEKLDQTGALVDAALAKGATSIIGLEFYSSTAAEARREALALAVKSARLDAEAMVTAAGYQLGSVIEISSGAPSDGPILFGGMARSMRAGAAPEPTPINPGELRVTENVTVKWAVKP